jgi:hypothetical protein
VLNNGCRQKPLNWPHFLVKKGLELFLIFLYLIQDDRNKGLEHVSLALIGPEYHDLYAFGLTHLRRQAFGGKKSNMQGCQMVYFQTKNRNLQWKILV